ncbi:cell wall hydrolase [Clostridium algoriphilum]|uniref:cell wall hydrolase n=1 Tax=Clostridium algoriphilum TaxID=198347 RepID=UPI001CF11D4F|nr:cell wall hydrolase [Clostridium algoriphilum]MCB2294033.1 cell wall hydrolase [Clostridium algoriphilum]
MAFSARELLARIIKCEAGGEGDNGMRAVASVIMNRVNVANGEYLRIGQGDLRKVIFQAGQFDCVATELGGLPNPQTIYGSPPEQIHYDIADWAIAGNRLYTTGESLWYFNPFLPGCPYEFPFNGSGSFQVEVAKHCFYNPTARYFKT